MEENKNEKYMTNPYSESDVLETASFIGRIILQNGGEVYRTEDVIRRVGEHYGYEIESFVTLTCIVVSLKGRNKEYNSIVTRIKSRSLNLNKIHKANKLVRRISIYSLGDFRERIKKIDENFFLEKQRYILGSALVGLSFGIVFGGGIIEGIIGIIGSLFIGLSAVFLEKYQINGMLVTIIGSAGATAIACLGTYLGYTDKTSVIIIACLMNLVPGLAFVNSIRDFIAGDLIAGSSRLMEVLMIATSLAIGTGMVIKAYGALGGVIY